MTTSRPAPSAAELAARQAKVDALVATAIRHGVKAQDALHLQGEGQRVLAELAGIREPSDTTWLAFVRALDRIETARTDADWSAAPSDPFDGVAA